jgi:hypothetical protein
MRTIDLRRAVDIEDLLVWTYRDQRADKVHAADHGLHEQEATLDGLRRSATSRDGVAAMARIGALGVRVTAGRASASALHDDAEVVHEAVMMLDRWTSLLMIRHARAATRPDHATIEPRRPGPLRDTRGRIVREYAEWDSSRRYGWTVIGWTVEPITPATVRFEYSHWRRALSALAIALATDATLARHRPTPPRAPADAALRFACRSVARSRTGMPNPDALLVA